MKELKRTSSVGYGRGSHYHVLFIDEAEPQFLSCMAAGHQHPVMYQPPQPPTPPSVDPMTGQQIPGNPGSPGGWMILPAPDGHTHDEIIPYEPKASTGEQTEEEVIREVLDLTKAAKEHWGESIKAGQESEDFYAGKQWDERTKNMLESMDRACVVVNFIQKHIKELCGHQREQRSDIKYTPMEGGDQRLADLFTIVSKHILERCYYEREESRVFQDMCVVGFGGFNIHVSFDDDLYGEIKIERYPWPDVLLGPCEKEDASDCEYLIKHKMYSKAKLRQMYGEKADKVEKRFADYLLENPTTHTTYQEDQYAKSDNVYPASLGQDFQLVDIAKKEFRLIECWRRVYRKVPVIAHPEKEFFFNAYGWKPQDLKAVAAMPGFKVIERNVPLMRVTRIAGGVVLSDENPADLAANDFFFVPAWGEKMGNRFWGKVEAAKDPQREVNKRHSQAIDIGNKMAAYLWFTDENTFVDSAEKERFRRYSSQPGAMFTLNSMQNQPQKVEGVKFPGELVQLMGMEIEHISTLMNITVQPQGANDSGAKLLTMQKMKLTGNEFLFDNLSFAKKKLGRLLVPLIQRYYSPERIYRIVTHQNAKKEVSLGGQPFEAFKEEEIADLLKDFDAAKYDVVVNETMFTPTTRLANFMLLSDLASKGAPIPPQVLVGLMDIPEDIRQQIIQGVQEQMQQAQTEQAETKDMELTKTLLAQGIVPPEIQQKMGVQPGQMMPQGQPPQGPPPQQQGPDPMMMQMMQMMQQAISRPMPTVMMAQPKPIRRRGRIIRDETGNAVVDIEEVPDEAIQ